MNKISLNSKEQKIWFMSDLHLGHDKPFILKPRNYSDIQEALNDTWKVIGETIGPDDIVFNLGDPVVGAGPNSLDYAKRLIHLPCKQQYFVWGNHNAGIKQIYDESMRILHPDLFLDCYVYPLPVPFSNFTFLGDYCELHIDKIPVILSHYPIASWNHLSKGGFHIHGHSHRNMKEDLNLKRIDVSWDYKKRPIEWNEIRRELEKRTTISPDHHSTEL
jgi:calcineurin-like phosphoesterase family protein